MEKQITVCIGAVLLLAVLNCSEAEVIPQYFEDGGTLTLRPDVTETITNILWKYNGNLVAEWVQGEVDLFYYEKYKDRTTLDTTTGQLVIKHMKKDDVGSYTVEINNKVHGQSYDVKWITTVPKPSAKFRPLTCGPESESCSVTCDGQEPGSLGDAEPIEYRWKIGERDWKTMTKDITITKAETQTEAIKTISCQMKNPVSQEDSKPEVNPMYTEPKPPPPPIVAIIVAIFAIIIPAAVFVLLWFFKRDLILRCIAPCRSGNDIEPVVVKGHQLVPSEDPNNSSGAQTNNSSGAQPDKSSGAQTNNSSGAQTNNSSGAQPDNSPGAQPDNSPGAQPDNSPGAQTNNSSGAQPDKSSGAQPDKSSGAQPEV